MFCEKCGSELGEKDVFCQKCGHPVGAEVTENSVNPESGQTVDNTLGEGQPEGNTGSVNGTGNGVPVSQGSSQAGFSFKGILKPKVLGIAAVALVAVILIVSIAGGKSSKESVIDELMEMSWNDLAELSAKDIKSMLSDADIRSVYDEESDYSWNLSTKKVSTYDNVAAMYEAVYAAYSLDSPIFGQGVILAYESRDEYKASRDAILKSMEKQMLKGTSMIEMDDSTVAVVGKYTEGVEKYVDAIEAYYDANGKDIFLLEDVWDNLEDYAVYKCAAFSTGQLSDFSIELAKDKDYINSSSVLTYAYRLCTENELIAGFARTGYDMIDQKDIDLDAFKDSDDLYNTLEECLGDSLNDYEDAYDNFVSRADDGDWYAAYMMAKHKFNIDNLLDFDQGYLSSDSEIEDFYEMLLEEYVW